MTQTEIKLIKITPSEGKVLTNTKREFYSYEMYLGIEDSASNYIEVDSSEDPTNQVKG